jgi:hypothetical protein
LYQTKAEMTSTTATGPADLSNNQGDESSNNDHQQSQQLTESLASAQISSPPPVQLQLQLQLQPLPLPLPSSLPTTISRSYKILGIPTDAYVQIFSDRIVVGVSQLRSKIGTWCLCQATQSAIDPKAIDFDISTVLGDRSDAMAGVYARQITERIIRQRLMISGGSTTMVVLLGISLQQPQAKDPQMFQTVVQVVLQLIQDALTQMRSK